MKKTARRSKKQQKRETNWKVIGGIVVISAVVLVGMMALAFREPNRLELAEFCDNNPGNCITVGPNDAKARIVEVSDYACPACQAFNLQTAPQLEEVYGENENVQYRVMPFALSNQGGTYPSMDRTVAAMCANEQEKFWEFHEASFAIQGSPSFNDEAGILETAESVELDMDVFSSCLADNEYEDIVRANIRAASAAGISSTPSFMIDGDVIVGAQPFNVFQQRIESLINQ